MKDFLSQLDLRQTVLGFITAAVLLTALVIHHYVIPAYDQWRDLRTQVELQATQYERLRNNLTVRDDVDRQFEALSSSIRQLNSDEITISHFLREIEAILRAEDVALINAKPLPTEEEEAYKIYKVKLSIAGKLQGMIRAVSEMTTGAAATGLERFVLRGTRGGDVVECSLCLKMIRLTGKSVNHREEPLVTGKGVSDEQ